jgi:general nucleoside transport system permease protein
MTYIDQEIDLVTEEIPVEDAPIAPRSERVRRALILVLAYAVSVAFALVLSAALIVFTKHSPHDAFEAMFNGSLKTKGAWGRTLEQASPLLLVALGAVISDRAGVFNIGQEGQMLIGAMAGTIVALKVHGPGPLMIVLVLVASFLGGAFWSGIAAGLKVWRNLDVVITTLLLIFISTQVVQFSVTRTWFLQQHNGAGIAAPQSDFVPSSVHMPIFGAAPGFYLQSGLVIGLVLAAIIAWLLARTRWGFRVKLLGHNPVAARHAGVNVVTVAAAALLVSGGLAGLAGGISLTSTVYTLQPTLSNNIGWTGLLVALIARDKPVAVVGVALFFGALRAGGGFLATTGIPKYLVDIIEAFLVLSTLFPPLFTSWLERRRVARAQLLVA